MTNLFRGCTDSIPLEKSKLMLDVRAQVDAFFAKGGVITEIPAGVMAEYKAPSLRPDKDKAAASRKFTINPRKKYGAEA